MKKAKKVAQYDLDLNLISIYPSMAQASRETGVAVSSISHCIQRRYDTAGNFIWKYYDDSRNINTDK